MARLLLLLAAAWAEDVDLALSADDCGDQECVLSALQLKGEPGSEELEGIPLEDEFDKYEAGGRRWSIEWPGAGRVEEEE